MCVALSAATTDRLFGCLGQNGISEHAFIAVSFTVLDNLEGNLDSTSQFTDRLIVI